MRQALQYALNHNVAVFASSGNSGNAPGARQQGHAPISFPADYPGVLGVGAVDQNGASAGFSSDNLSVQVAAPGVQVPTQGRDGQYWLVSGTSPACALTAGVAALIRSAYPALPPDLVREAITTTTRNRRRAATTRGRLRHGGRRGRAGRGGPAVRARHGGAGSAERAAPKRSRAAGSRFGGGPAAVPARRWAREARAARGVLRSGRGLPGDDRRRDQPPDPMRRPAPPASGGPPDEPELSGRGAAAGAARDRKAPEPSGRPAASPQRPGPQTGPRNDPRGRRSPAEAGAMGDFAGRVLDVAEAIPPGRVMSYGDIAEYLGEGGPRQVGRVMALWGGGVAWWRVIHADGSLLAGHEQAALARYREEGTPVRPAADGGPGRVDMRRARWDGGP